jgi:peptide/nickel transport system substrate-binding protein
MAATAAFLILALSGRAAPPDLAGLYQAAGAPAPPIARIIIGADGLRGFFKPHNARAAADRIVSEAIFEPLVTMGRDGLPVNALAEKVDISPDGLTYTVTLRQDPLFHKGQTLDGGDVAASYQAAAGRNSDLEIYLAGIVGCEDFVTGKTSAIAGIRVLDPQTVAFDFLAARSENIWALGLGIQDKEDALDEVRFRDTEWLNGTGPYRYGGYDRERREITLLAHAAYHGGAPAEDEIRVRDVPLAQAAAEYRQGNINLFSFGYDPDLLERLAGADDIDIYGYNGLECSFLGLNCAGEVMTADLRKALYFALDREGLAERAYQNRAAPIELPLPPDSWLAHLDGPARETGRGSGRADRLFAQAGYRRDREGRLMKDGQQLRLRIAVQAGGLARDELPELEARLTALGIDVEAAVYDSGEFREVVYQERAFDAYLQQWQTNIHVAGSSVFAAPTHLTAGAGWANEAALAAMAKIPAAGSLGEVETLYREIIAAYRADPPQIPLVARKRFLAAHPDIQGFSLSAFQSPFWNLAALFIRA